MERNEIKQQVAEYLENDTKRMKHGRLAKTPLWSHVLKHTSDLPEVYGPSRRVFHLLNDLSVVPICPHCLANPNRWMPNLLRYAETCSPKCFRNYRADDIRATNMQRYGGAAPASSIEVRARMTQTNLERYGVENASSSELIKERRESNLLKKYGVHNVSLLPEVREKISANQQAISADERSRIMRDALLSSKRYKEFVTPSGSTWLVQGFEPRAITILLETYREGELRCGCQGRGEIPTIHYNGNKVHFPDIFIPAENRLIEVKSTYLFNRDRDTILAKQRAAQDAGYVYEVWVFGQNDRTPTVT